MPLSHHDRLYHGVNFFFLKSGMPLRNERVIAVRQSVEEKIGANSPILSL